MTHTGGAPGLASSGVIVRPSKASTPITSNVLPERKAPLNSSTPSGPVYSAEPSPPPAITASNDVICDW